MAGRIDAYVDTSALIAFVDASDSYHPTFRRLFAAPPSVVVTSSLVVSEGHAWFLRRFDRARALQFLAMIDDMRPNSGAPPRCCAASRIRTSPWSTRSASTSCATAVSRRVGRRIGTSG